MSGARLLMLDDPFLGLAPRDVNRLCNTLQRIRQHGYTLFMAGQHVRRILKVANRAYLIEEGKITLSGSGDQLLDHPHLQESLFGIVARATREVPTPDIS
jgi:branched-chain amino acid transport system ATP-binding protein